MTDRQPLLFRSRLAMLTWLPRHGIAAELGVDEGAHAQAIIDYARPRKLWLIDAWEALRPHWWVPEGYEAQIRPRSLLSIKKGITLVNAVGTIDSDYTGEIKLPIINLSNEPYTIEDGERLAQMVIARYEKIIWQEVSFLDETERGEGGFGSTGTK